MGPNAQVGRVNVSWTSIFVIFFVFLQPRAAWLSDFWSPELSKKAQSFSETLPRLRKSPYCFSAEQNLTQTVKQQNENIKSCVVGPAYNHSIWELS